MAETLIFYVNSGADEYVLVELQDLTMVDIPANEFMYHRCCYRNICNFCIWELWSRYWVHIQELTS